MSAKSIVVTSSHSRLLRGSLHEGCEHNRVLLVNLAECTADSSSCLTFQHQVHRITHPIPKHGRTLRAFHHKFIGSSGHDHILSGPP